MRIAPALLAIVALVLAGCGSSNSSPSSAPPPSSGNALAAGGQNHVHSILVVPGNKNDLYMGTHYHLYHSLDGGQRWSPLLSQMVLSLAVDPLQPRTLYAVSLQSGLLKSTDAGAHWSVLKGVGGKGTVSGVVVAPATRTILAYGTGIYRSTDGGVSWSHVLAGQSLAGVAAGGGTIYAATPNGLFTSKDGGGSWHFVKAVGNQPAIQVAAAKSYAYVVTPIQLFRTMDGGTHWTAVGAAPQGIEFLGISASQPTELFAEVAGTGYWVTRDGGAHWSHANAGITDHNFSASTIRVAPQAPNLVYTGSWGVHFYRSQDAGRHWARVATLTH
ncbi:MAG: hypothetical protein M3Z66_02110 [Chloroflexota bacterium]|nr:hypothetical protein [Chloroflexota bacterium]